MKIVNILFPSSADNNYVGYNIAYWMFVFLAIIGTIRSLIHFLAPDGGAGSIAGLDLTHGAENIIFSFGLWGLSQLLYAFIQLLVAFRYRTLIPLFYVILIFEIVGRIMIGVMKTPILLQGTPPGGIANYVLLPLVIIMFVLSIIPRSR